MTNQQTTTTTMDGQTATLVLRDSAGSYYLVSQETLEQGRVPAERAAEIEGLIAAATQDGVGDADAQGYFLPLAFAFAGVFMGGMAGGVAIHRAINEGGGGASAHWSYFEDAYRNARLQ